MLIAEDDAVIAQGIARHLEATGFAPVVADDEALARLRFEQPDICVLDLMLPALDGWAHRPARGAGVRRRRERGADADGVQAPLHARPRARPRCDPGRGLQKIWRRRETHRDRTVDVFVGHLRDKIDRRASRHTFIQTRYGVGYKLEPVPKA